MILHRPYLRADPAAYPESSEICFRSAKVLLAAYAVGSKSKASIFWSWWTMSFRVSSSISVFVLTAGVPRWRRLCLPSDTRTKYRTRNQLLGQPPGSHCHIRRPHLELEHCTSCTGRSLPWFGQVAEVGCVSDARVGYTSGADSLGPPPNNVAALQTPLLPSMARPSIIHL